MHLNKIVIVVLLLVIFYNDSYSNVLKRNNDVSQIGLNFNSDTSRLISIYFEKGFKKDSVFVYVNNDLICAKKIQTNPSIELAGGTEFLIAEESYILGIKINKGGIRKWKIKNDDYYIYVNVFLGRVFIKSSKQIRRYD